MRLVISGGGTGGHIYPALAVVEVLLAPKSGDKGLPTLTQADLLWIGSQGGIEEDLVVRAGMRVIGLPAGGLRGKRVGERVGNLGRIVRSIGRARSILDDFRADVALVTGGYACVSVAVAAWSRRIPMLVYLPDIVPGRAIQLLSRMATQVAVTSAESRRYLRDGKIVVTGYPVRSDVFALDKTQARLALDLDPATKTLLVFGGSHGAQSLNRALVPALCELLPVCQILHISGQLDAGWVADKTESLSEALRPRYHHHAYLHDMPKALAAADLALSRAGAAVLGEFPAAGLPAVLVPYPYSGQHQEPNAQYMARRGAATVLADAQLSEELVPTLLELFEDEDRLAGMQKASRAMARPGAAESIAEQLWLLSRRHRVNRVGAPR